MTPSADSSFAASPSHRRRFLSIGAVIAAATVFGLTYSLSSPLIAVILKARGYSDAFIGANTAMQAVGVLLIAPVLPWLAARTGARRLTVAALLLAALALALFALWPAAWAWFPLRVLLGVAGEALFVMSETWANALSDEGSRGRTMAIYTAALSLGMMLGPAVLSQLGTGTSSFVVGALIAAFAVAFVISPLVLAPARAARERVQPLRYLRLAPIAISTTVLNAGIETAGLSFITLYAVGLGWPEARGMQLISVLMLGAIILQLPIGWLADKVDRRRLALWLAWISAATALLWPFVLRDTWLAFGLVFVWGGLFVGIYTVMLTLVGSRFKGGDLVGVYAVMGLAWGVGALVGPTVAGVAMQGSVRFGLPVMIAAACALFAVYMMRSRSEA